MLRIKCGMDTENSGDVDAQFAGVQIRMIDDQSCRHFRRARRAR